VTEEDSAASGDEEDVLYRANRKTRQSHTFTQASRRQKRRTQRRSGSADSASEEDGEGESPSKTTSPRGRRKTTQRDARYTSDVETMDAVDVIDVEMALKDDDICALCGQAWVTQQEILTFLDLKTQELLLRSPGLKQVPSSQNIRESSPCPCPASGSFTPIACNAATPSRSPRGSSRMCGSDSLLSLVSIGSERGTPIVNTRVSQAITSPALVPVEADAQPRDPSAADMLTMMILCDGCDGSYHMICVGKCLCTPKASFFLVLTLATSFRT